MNDSSRTSYGGSSSPTSTQNKSTTTSTPSTDKSTASTNTNTNSTTPSITSNGDSNASQDSAFSGNFAFKLDERKVFECLALDGIDSISLGEYEYIEDHIVKRGSVADFEEIIHYSISCREGLVMEDITQVPDTIFLSGRARMLKKWIALVPHGNNDDYNNKQQHGHQKSKIVDGNKNNTEQGDDRSVASSMTSSSSSISISSSSDRMPSFVRLLNFKALDEERGELMKAQNLVARLLRNKRFDEAISILRNIEDVLRSKYGKHFLITSIVQNVGNIYLRCGLYDKAMVCFNEARKVWATHGRCRIYELIVSMNKEGLALFAMGEMVYALNKFNSAATLCESTLLGGADSAGMTYASLSKIRNNIASTLCKMGKEKCIAEYLRAIHMHGKGNSEMKDAASVLESSVTISNLGYAYLSRCQSDEAVPILKAAHELQKQSLNEGHIICIATMQNLAFAYMNHGNPDSKAASIDIYKNLIAIHEQKYGVEHVKTALLMGKVSIVYISLHQFHLALKYLHGMFDCQRKAYQSDYHPEVLNTAATIRKIEMAVSAKQAKQQEVMSRLSFPVLGCVYSKIV